MSETPHQPVQLPSSEDIRKINAQLREDVTAEVRTEVADRLVLLAAREPHPRAKAAMLERAARLVADVDPERSVFLLRESFRHFPDVDVGLRLAAAGDEDPALRRLGRMSALYDSIAAIAEDDDARRELLIGAATYHVERGHGARALRALDKLAALGEDDETLTELRAAAETHIEARAEELRACRERIVGASDETRGMALLEYARTLLQGDEPLDDASAVLADAADDGGDLRETAPLWAEVARAVGEPEMLARALAACLNTTQDEHERVRVADELVNLPGVDARTPELAQAALLTLVTAMPDDAGLRARLLAARSATGDTAADKELDRMRLDAVRARDRATEAVVCLALAKVAGRRKDMAKVERYLRRVRTLDPRNSEALDFFEDRYREAGDHRRLYMVLTHRLAISQGEDLVRIALEMARLAEGPMANRERAIEAYGRVLAVHPHHRASLDALERLYRATRRWTAVRDLLDRRAINLGTHAEATPEILQEGRHILEQLAAMHGADGELPDEEALFQTYRRLHIVAPDHVEAADFLIDRYRRDQAWRPLASVLEARVEHATDDALRAACARELYSVYHDKLGDPMRARAALSRATDGHGDDLETLRLLARAHAAADEQEELQGVRARMVPLLQGDEQITALEEAAAWAAEHGDPQGAIAWYEQLLEKVPGHTHARRGLTRLYGQQGLQTALATLIQIRLEDEALDRDEKISLLETLARTRAELNDDAGAERAAAALRELAPESETARSVTGRALLQRADWAELRAMYGPDAQGAQAYVQQIESQADGLAPPARARALLAIAEACSAEIGDPRRAAESAHRALLALLDAEEIDEELVATAARGLLSHAEDAGLLDMQSIAVAMLVEHSDGELRRMYMAQRVALCEEQGDAQGAFEAMTALLSARMDEGDLEGISGAAERLCDLAELAQAEDETQGLLSSWAEMAATAGEDEGHRGAAVTLWAMSATQAMLRGGRLDEALDAVQSALERGPDDPGLWLLREQVCSDLGRWDEVVTSLERRAALLPQEERLDVLLRAAALCDGAAQDPGRSETLYRAIIAERASSEAAWAGLLAQLRQRDDREALAEALDGYLALPGSDRAALATAGSERVQMLVEDGADDETLLGAAAPVLARIAADEGGQALEAELAVLQALVRRVEQAPAPALASAIMPALRRLERHGDLLTCHRAMVSEAKAGSDAHVGGLLRMARISRTGLSDAGRAWRQLREALIAAPAHPEVWAQLEELAREDDRREALYALLAALAGAADLEDVRPIEDEATLIAMLERWSALAQARGDADAAVQALSLHHRADQGALAPLEGLEALHREKEDHDAIAFVLEERLRCVPADDDAEGTWLRLADLHLSERGAPEEALDVLTRARAALPGSEAVAAMHLAVLRDHGAPEALHEALQARLEALEGGDDDDLRALLLREATILREEALGDAGGALDGWMTLLRADRQDDQAAEHAFDLLLRQGPGAEDRLAELQALLAERGDHERVDALLTLRVEAAEGAGRAALLREQAKGREEALGSPALAFESLARALALRPEDDAVAAEIERLAAAPKDAPPPDSVAAAFADAAAGAEDRRVRRGLRDKAASLYLGLDEGRGEAGAIGVYHAMLADDPRDTGALDQLDTLLSRTGDDRARMAVLEARSRAADDPEVALGAALEHARLASRLGEDDVALGAWARVAELGDAAARGEAAMALVDLHERRGAHAEQARATLMLRDLAEEDDEKLGLGLQAADLLALGGETGQALEVLRQAETLAPDSPAVYAALEERLRADGDGPGLLDLLRRGWREVFASDPDFADSRLAAALGHLEQLETEGAGGAARWEALAEMLDAGLDDDGLRLALAELANDEDDAVAGAAADRAVALHEARGDAAAALAARLARLARFPERPGAREERAAIATLLEGELGDERAALAQWQALVEADATDMEAVEAALRLGDATGAGADTEALILDALAGLPDPAARNRLRLLIAARMSSSGREDEALALLDTALQEVPRDEEAYVMRGAILQGREGAEAHLLAHHAHGVAHAPDPAARRLARTQLAALHLDMGQADRAFEDIVAEIEATERVEERGDLYRLAEAFADEAGLREPLWAVLEREARELGETPEAARRRSALAARCLQDEAAHARAREHAQEALRLDPELADAALQTLEEVYAAGTVRDDALLELLAAHAEGRDVARLSGWLDEAARAAEDAGAAAAWWGAMAQLAGSEAGARAGLDPVDPLARLALAGPSDAGRWERLQDAAGQGRRDEVLSALATAWDASDDVDLRADLMIRAADLSEGAGDAETAAAYLRMALEEREDAALRGRLRRLLSGSGAFEALALELETEASADEPRRTALLLEALDVWLEKVGDADEGLRVLDELLALHPERLDLQDRRLDVLRLKDEGAWAEALRAAVAEAREAGDEERVARLLPGLVELQGEEEPPRTVLGWLREMRRGQVPAPRLAGLAARLLDRVDALEDEAAMEVLEMVLAGTDPAAEPGVWMGAALQRADRLGDEGARREALEALSEHARDHMDDADLAVEWLARAHVLETSNLGRALRLLELADTPLRRETVLPVARASLQDEQMSVPDRVTLAEALLRPDLDDDETWQLIETSCNDKAFCLLAAETLVPGLRERGQHDRAVELRRRALAWLPVGSRGEAVVALGRMTAEDLRQPADAVQLMLDHVPEVREPLAVMDAACDLAREHDLLIDWLEGVELLIAGEMLSGEEATAAVGLAAGVAAADLGDPGRAADLWGRAWDLDPDSDDARDAVLALRREAGDAETLAVDLDRALLQTDGDEAADLRLELARLCLDRLNRPAEALHQVRAVLRDHPGHGAAVALAGELAERPACAAQALETLEPIHREAENWAGLADVLERRLALRSTGPEAAASLRALADLQERVLDRPADALASLLRLLKIAPDGALAERSAALARRLGDTEALGQIWTLALGDRLPQRDREAVLATAGAWYREQGDDARAETLWSELVALSPIHQEAWEGLDAIYDEAGRWADLVALLQRRAEVTTDRDTLRVILHRLGGIAQASERPEAAVAAYERLSKLDRDDPDPLAMLVELLRVTDRHAELAGALQRLAGRLSDDEERARLLCEAARLHQDRLGSADRAAELYHRAFELAPSSDEAFIYLERRWQTDAKRLMRLYRHRASGVPVGPSRTLVLRKLATVCSGLGRHGEARAALNKAREDDPGNPVIDEALLEICLVQGDVQGYLATADRRLAGQMGRGERVALLREVVRLCVERELDAPHYVQELGKLVPDDPELPLVAAMMMARSEDPEQAAEGLERVIRQTEGSERQVALLERLAELYAGPLDNPRKAIGALQGILKINPDRWDAHRGLCDLYARRGSDEARVACLRNWLDRLPEGDKARVPVLGDLGESLLAMGQRAGALECFEQAYVIDTEDPRINRALAELLEETGERERAAGLQRWVVKHLRRTRRRDEVPAAATRAGTMLEALGRHEEARRMFRTALGGDPRLAAAILGLARTSLALGDVGRAMAEFEKVAHHMGGRASTAEQAEAELGLGRCWRQRGKRHQARASFNRAIELKPDLREAIEELSEV